MDVVNDADVFEDPYRALGRLRDEWAILLSPALGGCWPVLDADEVREAFQFAGDCELIADLARPLRWWVSLDHFGLPTGEADKFTSWTEQLLHGDHPEKSGRIGGEIVGCLTDPCPQEDGSGRRPDRRPDPGRTRRAQVVRRGTPRRGVTVVHRRLGRSDEPARRHLLRPRPEPGRTRRVAAGLPDRAPRAGSDPRPLPWRSRDEERGTGSSPVRAAPAATPRSIRTTTRVRLDRDATWNTAFGFGPHRCLDAHLARQELTIVLEQFAIGCRRSA